MVTKKKRERAIDCLKGTATLGSKCSKVLVVSELSDRPYVDEMLHDVKGPVKVLDMNFFVNCLLKWTIDWPAIEDPENSSGLLWVHEITDPAVREVEEGYSSEELE